MSERPVAAPPQIPDHTLLRVIGRGSYGEVWLARNVMGTQRAVKIVRRSAFDSDRPWLREFEGIRRCEPVSRAHDGLIDILHMGRNEAEGFFYYVMELADAAGGSAEYTPATLSARLHAGKALDITECLRLAESLAGALAFLHEQGLIHRDVKPSNVLYTGGVPKLGDIGLVAEAGSSRSFVGTEGFVPLEGPGTERADIFALGKVLYEALTGLDREKFPRLPPWWADDAEFEQRVELNEIVLRACEGDPTRRYHTAREMLSDVALVASGRSVKKMRGMERRLKALRWAGTGAAVVAALAMAATWLGQQQAERERTLRVRAQKAEQAALVNLVRTARHDPSTGAVTHALAVAREAAAVEVTPELRNDAIFLLSRPDFVLRDDSKFTFTHPLWTIDADSMRMAEMEPRPSSSKPGQLTVIVHTAGAASPPRKLHLASAPPALSALKFSRGGTRLLVTGRYGQAVVFDTATGELLHPDSLLPGYPGGSALTFCGDKGDSVIRRSNDGGLAIFTLPGGERRTTPVIKDWPQRNQTNGPYGLWPSPDGRLVLLIDHSLQTPWLTSPGLTGAACLVETDTARTVWRVPGATEQAAAWSRDGTRIALRRGDFIVSLDAATGKQISQVPRRIQNAGTQMTFLGSRDLLVFSTYSMTGLCDLAREEILGLPPVLEKWSYSPARGLLMGGTGTAEWKPSPVLRTLQPVEGSPSPVYYSFSPDEKWLIAGHGSHFNWWNLDHADNVPAALTPAHFAANVLFSADGSSLQFLTNAGRHQAPWLGQPVETLPEPPLSYGKDAVGRSDYISASGDGKTVAFSGRGYITVHREGAEPRHFPAGNTSCPVNISRDGALLAAGVHHGDKLRIFNLDSTSDEPIWQIECGSSTSGVFSPDGRWLVVSSFAENRVFDTTTRQVVYSRPRRNSSLMGYVSFTTSGDMFSVMDSLTRCVILEPGTWRELYQLDSPLDEIFERNGLSASGRYFIAVGTRREIYLWDLHAMKRELTALGLGKPPVQ